MDKIDIIRNIAIEFAKYLMEQNIRKHTSFNDFTEYNLMEYQILRAELQMHGAELFDEFYKQYSDDLFVE